MFIKKLFLLSFIGITLVRFGFAQENLGYQLPPQSIIDLVDAPTPPKMMIDEDRNWMLVLRAPRYVDMDLAAYPIVGLAGLRINPMTHTLEAENHGFFTSLEIKSLKDNSSTVHLSGLPQDLKMSNVHWQPNGQGFAFTNRTERGLELWYADLLAGNARKLGSQRLNALNGQLMQWHPKGDFLLVQVPGNEGKAAPVKDRIPHGPVIMENLGTRSPSRTYSNLLGNKYDEDLLDYYATSQLTKVYLDGRSEAVGSPAIFTRNVFSPDGSYLLAEWVSKPYSYTQPINSFPKTMEIWDHEGRTIKQISTADTSRSRGRSYDWRKDQPNELVYVSSFDRKQDSVFRDGVYGISAPFDTEPRLIFRTKMQFGDITWGDSQYAIIRENDRASRKVKLTLINPETGAEIKVIEERSSEDNYANPGNFVLRNGLLQISGKNSPIVHTISSGASPQGEQPFLLQWDLIKDQRDTLFKSHPERYEMPVDFDGQQTLFFTRETWNIPPNMIHYDLRRKRETALTQFDTPYPGLAGVTKTLMSYSRKDSVKLSGTLYLPPGFEPHHQDPLPVVVWAYPREYKSAELASQVRGSPHKFTELNFRSAVYWVTRGYAVVDMADMPIIGEGEEEPNDTFVEQLISNSEALIDHMVDAGIADRHRFGVGGHSYGAFMTANLLAHSDLFAAGIARSGAYNRTLTPFGFQSESRTYWRAKDVYDRMSPFTYADKIKLPILITHGIDDENSGTFPVQSERLYAAIKGNGGTVRLVMFPHEFHGFRSRESIMHVFWEQDQWLEKYVKNREKKDVE
ncbi:MAG TPA: prolyl oligopeptidase family serine peptidase [Sphingobacteriaceae bacterium]|nr:prolyl oligopeptidase family serine peptidase [Sphingobacteriaceae bacterium]